MGAWLSAAGSWRRNSVVAPEAEPYLAGQATRTSVTVSVADAQPQNSQAQRQWHWQWRVPLLTKHATKAHSNGVSPEVVTVVVPDECGARPGRPGRPAAPPPRRPAVVPYIQGALALIAFILLSYLFVSLDSFSLIGYVLVRVSLPSPSSSSSSSDVRYLFSNVAPSRADGITRCEVCKAGVRVVQSLIASNESEAEIAKGFVEFCVRSKVQQRRVCVGLAREFQDEILYLLRKLTLKPEELCGFVRFNICQPAYEPFLAWNVTLTDVPKPPLRPLPPPKVGVPRLRVLQLADIHLDFAYRAGTNAECAEPLCCRNASQAVKGKPAGKWGDYRNCDTPPALLDNLLEHLEKNEKFDYIMWTGDMPAHNVWQQDRSSQLQALQYLTDRLGAHFPGVPVFPALGNHESAPVNSFPQPFIGGRYSISWLYDDLARRWSRWLPNGTAYSISRGGFYTTLIRPGLRIISVNTNYCNTMNWWLLLNMTDPAQELQWLISILQSAEDKGDKVHILGHIPPGSDDCLTSWSSNYYKIVNRYEATIRAQFFGHTHVDQLQIFYDEDEDGERGRPTSVAYVGPSVTTFQQLNPGYRVYDVEGGGADSERRVLDHETYILNLTEANASDKPLWQKEYTAKAHYGMEGLEPADWNALLERMKQNRTTFDLYYKLYYKSHPPASACDAACRRYLLCEIQSARSNDTHRCDDVSAPDFVRFKRAKSYC